ncbi:dihydroorotate dehydrogenase [Fervidicella metallireducens AeB]|uniref:Dihydroorotate dehydrogenase n=1 Tax=Fervidicella metallireducens AeB TaxID=1403537 RepID=A0A017RX17_9CLOT|nr:undecaprenyl diphosphate synthase family protein [Fervidicella metallireducens]EYE89106.1 dihydroorotate dehydrogenase [Fervidicella metallireducens AeB]
MRIPEHIGIIPDGNRRWATENGLSKEMGYSHGLNPGLELLKLCKKIGVKELTFYGFTVDNTKRPSAQTNEFVKCCVDAVKLLSTENAELLVIGDTESKMFPKELLPLTKRHVFGKGGIKVNFLVNYGWDWDLSNLGKGKRKNIMSSIYSSDISRIDLIIRWGGRRRLSGFLPVQAVYADFYIIDDYWPDFKPEHFYEALEWYDKQDVTLGG